MSKTAWKEYNGVEITIDENGYFHASVGSVHVHDGSWERLRLRIEEEKKADAKAAKITLECVALLGNDDEDYSVQRATLIGLNRSDSTFKFQQGIDGRRVQYVLPYTTNNMALLEELATAKATVRDIQVSIKDRVLHQNRWGGRIEPTKYPEELERLKERYSVALKPPVEQLSVR